MTEAPRPPWDDRPEGRPSDPTQPTPPSAPDATSGPPADAGGGYAASGPPAGAGGGYAASGPPAGAGAGPTDDRPGGPTGPEQPAGLGEPPPAGSPGYPPPGPGGPGYPPPGGPGYGPGAPGYGPGGPGYGPGGPGYGPGGPGYPPGGYGQPGYPYGGSASEDRTWALVAHFGGAAGALLGGGVLGWIAPLVALVARGNQSAVARAHAAAALNFQLVWTVVGAVGWALTCIFIGLVGVFAAMIVGTVFGIIAGIKAANGEPYRYPMTVNWVK